MRLWGYFYKGGGEVANWKCLMIGFNDNRDCMGSNYNTGCRVIYNTTLYYIQVIITQLPTWMGN